VTIRFLILPVAGLQAAVFCPGTPNKRSIVASVADLRFLLNVSLGGMFTMSAGAAGTAISATLFLGAFRLPTFFFSAGFFFAAFFLFATMFHRRGHQVPMQ
jgi:hypothetical protein